MNTKSRRGIKQLGISLGSIFVLFSFEAGATFIVAGGDPQPPPLHDSPAVTLFGKSRGHRPKVMVYLTCAIIGLGGRGVIKTWTEVAAGVRLYILMSDLTSLVPLQFSHWLQVRKVGTIYNIFIYFFGDK